MAPEPPPSGNDLREVVERVAVETTFSGVVRVDRGADVELLAAYGEADRRWSIANTPDTRFATASGTKGLTALAVVTLIEDGTLDLTTTARSLLGGDLPLVDDAVTVEQLLAHRSGIGDYLDEDADLDLNDYLLPVPVHTGGDRGLPAGARRATRRSSRRASGSPTAMAATWCSP